MMKSIFYLSLLVLITSCSSNVDLAIDNPTDNPVHLKIDSLTIEVPAKEVVWVEMGQGNHQIKLENDSIIHFNFTESSYMINPSLSEYLLSEQYYGNDMFYKTYELTSAARKKTVTYFGIEFEGNYDVIKSVINPITWEYGPRESLPQSVEVEENTSYTVVKKLMDPQEFIAMIQENQQAQ